jgi:hypothetical protein
MMLRLAFVKAFSFDFIKAFLIVFIPTCVIICETMCDQMMKNVAPLSKLLLAETIYTGEIHCLNTTVLISAYS